MNIPTDFSEDSPMTQTMHQIPNGTVRKNLASQLDRLDRILDGLADGLQGAVADAVKAAVAAAVEQAVKAVLTEVLTNPDLLATLRAAGVQATPGSLQKDQLRQSRVRACLSRASAWVTSA